MLIDKTNGYLAKTKELAVAAGEQATAALQKQLDYLGTYAQGRADTYLYKDFAPHSFTFRIVGTKLGDTWLDGGLIYSGPGMNGSREQRSDGSGPSFTVSLTPAPANEHHWGVHT